MAPGGRSKQVERLTVANTSRSGAWPLRIALLVASERGQQPVDVVATWGILRMHGKQRQDFPTIKTVLDQPLGAIHSRLGNGNLSFLIQIVVERDELRHALLLDRFNESVERANHYPRLVRPGQL